MISGSFQAFYQRSSSMCWSGSVPHSWALPVWLDAASALREVAAANPGALMFETELPSARASRLRGERRVRQARQDRGHHPADGEALRPEVHPLLGLEKGAPQPRADRSWSQLRAGGPRFAGTRPALALESSFAI